MNHIDELALRLQPHYKHFDVANRLLFTGHSHQAWPDVALEGLKESYKAAANEVDKKWETAFDKAEVLRNYLREFYNDPSGLYCLAENTHLLLIAWLSSFDLKNRSKIITTNGEFHSMYRQLNRLREEGIKIVEVEAESEDIAEQISDKADNRTAAIMLSRVYFESGLVNPDLKEIAIIARQKNIPLLVDDYHGTNVTPFSIREEGLEDCYFLIGGYKYLQWGEGNCFLRFPAGCNLRPAITGWFASFSTLDEIRNEQPVQYDDGNQRFASGTYDPASQFRAAKVVRFFGEQNLTPKVLEKQYRSQVGMLRSLFRELDLDPEFIRLRHSRPLEQNGGFLALRSPKAREIQAELMHRGVYSDARGEILRLGPAPYVTTDQIEQCMQALSEAVRTFQ